MAKFITKRITSLTLAGITIFILNSCKKDNEDRKEMPTCSQTQDIKKFTKDIIPTTKVDWNKVEKIVRENYPNFLTYIEHEYKGKDYFSFLNFNIGAFETGSDLKYHIINKEGTVIDDLTFISYQVVNETTSLLEYAQDLGDDINSFTSSDLTPRYLLLNHLTGNAPQLNGKIEIIGDYLIRRKDDHWPELLYPNGELVSDSSCTNIIRDEATELIYLVKLYNTDVLDPKSSKVRTINGLVTDAFNGYLIIDGCSVAYLKELNTELTIKIPDSKFVAIKFAHKDKTKSVRFICSQKNDGLNYDGLYDENGQRLSIYYGVINQEIANSGYLPVVNIYSSIDFFTGLINADGEEMILPEKHNVIIINIVKDKIIFKAENNKVGIMSLVGKVLIEPIFDEITVSSNRFRAIIIDEKFNLKVTIFDIDLNIVIDEKDKTRVRDKAAL